MCSGNTATEQLACPQLLESQFLKQMWLNRQSFIERSTGFIELGNYDVFLDKNHGNKWSATVSGTQNGLDISSVLDSTGWVFSECGLSQDDRMRLALKRF